MRISDSTCIPDPLPPGDPRVPTSWIGSPNADPAAQRSRATWTAGDFDRIAEYTRPAAEEFMARLAVSPGERVLDVACGSGNLAIPAARAGAVVTGLDIAPNLLAAARRRATAEGVPLQLDEGNAEALPYPDGSFDTVVSMFGAMFAARPERVAAELIRVTRPGGRIAMANWTPDGYISRMFRVTAGFLPPPADLPSPLQWGDAARVTERLGGKARVLACTERIIHFSFPYSPAGVVELFQAYYGPTLRTFDALGPDERARLRRELERLWRESNTLGDGQTSVEAEYLEVIAIRAA